LSLISSCIKFETKYSWDTDYTFPVKTYVETKHQDVKPDVFGFGEKEKSYELIMKMSLRAWLFLKDEYPMTIPYTKKDS